MTGSVVLAKNPLLFNLILFIAKTDDGIACSGWCCPKKNTNFTITSSFWAVRSVVYLKTRTYAIDTASWYVNTAHLDNEEWHVGQVRLENSTNSPVLSQSDSIAITQAIGWY